MVELEGGGVGGDFLEEGLGFGVEREWRESGVEWERMKLFLDRLVVWVEDVD